MGWLDPTLLVILLFLRCFLCAVAGAVSSGGGEVWADVVGSCAGEGVGSEVVGGIEDDVAGPDVVGDTGGGTVGSVAAGDADGDVVGFGARRRLRRSSRRRGSWIWVDGWAGWIRRCW